MMASAMTEARAMVAVETVRTIDNKDNNNNNAMT